MSMIKILPPNSWEFGEQASGLIKLASSGVKGSDLAELIKKAGHEMALAVKGLKKEAGEELIYMIAVGATEAINANKNGDGFKAAACRKYHNTFKKHAKFYRNHQSKDPMKSYGVVKHSMFNENMQRIELIAALNTTKEAAERNYGLVADKELEMLNNGQELAVSMSCFVPGTPVSLSHEKQVPIEDITIGTKVFTHQGNVKPVEALIVNHYEGEVIRITVSGIDGDIVCTPNHKFHIRPHLEGNVGTCPVCGNHYNSLFSHVRRRKDEAHVEFRKKLTKNKKYEGWYTAAELRVNDFVRSPFINKYKDSYLSGEFEASGRTRRIYLRRPIGHPRTFSYCCVTEIKKEHYSGPVYNLTVADDNSYLVRDIAVSNCKVAFDVCSYCGNKAKNRREYCESIDEGGHCKGGGLKHNIGTVLENGHMLHADNPHPTFFDISRVYKPADRTAYVFGKVASGNKVISGAELAEMLNVSAPPGLIDPNADVNTQAQIKLAYALVERERDYLRSNLDRVIPTTLPSSLVSKLANYHKPDVFKSLQSKLILLSPVDWLRVITNEAVDKCAAVASDIKASLPDIFSELKADVELEELIQANPSKCSSAENVSINNSLTKYANDYSLSPDFVKNRIWKSVLQNDNIVYPDIQTKAASTNPVAKQLAKQYAVYQLNFLHGCRESPNFNLICDLTIRQNRN